MPVSKVPSTLRAMALLFFRPSRLAELCDGEYQQFALIRTSLCRSLVCSAFTVVVGVIAGAALRFTPAAENPHVAVALQLAAAAIVLWATLGLVGWKIQTWNGETLPEKVNQALFKCLYVLGTFLIIVSLTI
ncbi:MAG: hypothetical protein ACREQI_09455 [Candidatus Binataceae bacterium]